MKAAVLCAILFLVTFSIHVIWWRIRLPQHQISALVKLFSGTFAAAVVLIPLVDGSSIVPIGTVEWIHIGVVYLPVSLAYIATYSAIEEDSPSLRIVRYVHSGGEAGRSREELGTVLNEDVMIGSRLHAMMRDGLVVNKDGQLVLTARGRLFGRVFSWSSSVLGITAAG